ncbi:C-x8-C-x5-C-x3-H type zinc finger protein-like protein [Xylariales sp. PMI_506]|nr:C-x8-C-x5-C-x3-H type zinc finger protein-like protein [Xylariales sp. PMI_506]
MAAPLQVESIMDFVPQYREYQASRDRTEQFIKDLMIHCENVETTLRQENQALLSRMRNMEYDYKDSVSSQLELQLRIKALEEQLQGVSQDNNVLKRRNPYVLILIDGDGLIFKDQLVRQGLEGGKKAAYALRQAVAARCDDPDETQIIAKIIANLSGLNQALKRDGSVDSENDLADFMLGFTQADAAFDFVDVGNGKEQADFKIKETTRFHLRNYNCKQILLGISHDAGYAPFLNNVLRDDNTKRRVSILEGLPTEEDLLSTGVDVLAFEEIFRAEKLADRTGGGASMAASGISYATVTQKASPPPQITIPLVSKAAVGTPVRTAAKPIQTTVWNPGTRGLDPPIHLNAAVLEQVKKRKDSDKLCNNHYLRGPCAKGDTCCFEHHYKPNTEEIKAIQFLARLNPCTNGQDCDVDNCIYGHHCPSVINGVCTHPFCKFHPHEHPPGTKLKTSKKSSSHEH